jgi:hypothetical protein
MFSPALGGFAPLREREKRVDHRQILLNAYGRSYSNFAKPVFYSSVLEVHLCQ